MEGKKLKNRIICITLILIFLLSIFCACNNGYDSGKIVINKDFSVTIYDLGENDATFISFGDGKCMLIGSGGANSVNIENVLKNIKGRGFTCIDYFVCTHIDSEIILNNIKLLNEIEVKKVYIPDIKVLTPYKTYSDFLSLLNDKKIEYKISSYLETICSGESYDTYIISPEPYSVKDGIYKEFFLTQEPNQDLKNNLSPVVFFRYKDKRFLFTNYVTTTMEKRIINLNSSGMYKQIFGKDKVCLENIDVLEVSNHGDSTTCSQEFLSLVHPKYSVISVGGNNLKNHPDYSVLYRLNEVLSQVYRTDVVGSVVFNLDKNSNLIVKVGQL